MNRQRKLLHIAMAMVPLPRCGRGSSPFHLFVLQIHVRLLSSCRYTTTDTNNRAVLMAGTMANCVLPASGRSVSVSTPAWHACLAPVCSAAPGPRRAVRSDTPHK